MLQNIHSILIGITEEGEAEERSSATAYGLSLARQHHGHLTRADMMLMGAYVHSRLREIILGGTTQSLLKNAPAPRSSPNDGRGMASWDALHGRRPACTSRF